MNRAEIIITESRVPGREMLNLSPPPPPPPPIPAFACSSVRDRITKGGGSKGGPPALAGTTGIGSRQRVLEVLWNLEYPVGLSQKKNMCAF